MYGTRLENMYDFNLNLKTKLAWRFQQPRNALWAKVMKGIYYIDDEFRFVRKGRKTSWVWSRIEEGR